MKMIAGALHPTAMAAKEAMGLHSDAPLTALADKGYFNAQQLQQCFESNILTYVPPTYNRAAEAIARVKYNVDFASSNVFDIRDNINRLKENLKNGNHNNVHVGYDFTFQDVEHIEALLDTILTKYAEAYSLKAVPNKKIYTLIQQIREAETQAPAELAKEVLTQIFTPSQLEKPSRKERIKAEAERKSKERAITLFEKTVLKRGSKWWISL